MIVAISTATTSNIKVVMTSLNPLFFLITVITFLFGNVPLIDDYLLLYVVYFYTFNPDLFYLLKIHLLSVQFDRRFLHLYFHTKDKIIIIHHIHSALFLNLTYVNLVCNLR